MSPWVRLRVLDCHLKSMSRNDTVHDIITGRRPVCALIYLEGSFEALRPMSSFTQVYKGSGRSKQKKLSSGPTRPSRDESEEEEEEERTKQNKGT
jgi:hypothetical protein